MLGRLRLAPLLASLVILAVLTLAGGSRAADLSAEALGDPLLVVQADDGDTPGLDLALDFPGAVSAPARIALYVPKGFAIYPQRPAGFPVGAAELYATDVTAGAAGSTVLAGQIVGGRLDPDTEAALQACSAGPHVAVWEVVLNLLGQPLQIPLAISAADAGDPPDAQLEIDVCTPSVVPAGVLLPLSSLELSLWELVPPAAPGAYLWRAVITPVAPDRTTPQPERAYELRAVVPVPQALSLRAYYSALARRVTLRGSLREAGRPVAGARVAIVKLVRKVTPSGVVVRDSTIATVRTDARGAYALSARLTQTAGFVALSGLRLGRCPDAGTTPAGCRVQTVAGTQSTPITISVPLARG